MYGALLLLLLPCWGLAAPEGAPISQSAGAHLLFHPEARVATGHTEMVINVNLPKLDFPGSKPSQQSCDDKPELYAKLCKALDAVDATSYEIVTELKSLFFKSDDLIVSRRTKRAVLPFLGSFGRWIAGDVLEEDLDRVIEKVNAIGHRAVDMANRQVMFENITTQNFMQMHTLSKTIDANIKNLANQINSFQTQMAKTTSEDEILIFRLATSSMFSTKINLLLTHLATLKSLFEGCHSHTLSHLAVSREQLLAAMQNEEIVLKRKNARFVHGPAIIESVYSYKTAQCLVNKDYSVLSVSLSLPVQPLNTHWKVAELRPLKFLYQGLTCNVLEDTTMLAVNDDGTVLPLDSTPEGTPPVYLLPRHVNAAQLSRCFVAMAKSQSLHAVAEACVLHCERTSATTVQFITNERYTVLNPKDSLEVICSNKVRDRLRPIQDGRHQLELPCSCLVQSTSEPPETLIEQGTACTGSASTTVITQKWASDNFSIWEVFGAPHAEVGNISLPSLPAINIVTPPPAPSGNFYTDLPLSGMSHTEFWLWTLLATAVTIFGLYISLSTFLPAGMTSAATSWAWQLCKCCSARRHAERVTEGDPKQEERRSDTSLELGPLRVRAADGHVHVSAPLSM